MPPRIYNFPALSPDGRQIATSIQRGAGQDLWVFDVDTGAGLRLTHDDETNWIPTWAPDGQRIFFSSTRDAPRPASFTGNEWYGNIYSVAADGSSEPERVTTTEENQGVTGISPDGGTLVHSHVFTNADHWEIMALPADGNEAATPLVSGPYRRGSGTISPDGRWLAYRSDESGTFEVFVEPYPGPGAKVPASIGGGTHPGWSADSRELFYRGADGTMMSATIGGEGTPEVIDRTPLFSHRPYRSGGGFRLHDEAPDGRFLMMRQPGSGAGDSDTEALRITVVDNWFEELRERVPN
jgi:Tol biopolymer transport system component